MHALCSGLTKRGKKFVFYVLVFVLAILAIISASVFIQTVTNPDKVPSVFGYKPFVVLSGSMETEMYKGDLAITQSMDVKDLKEGDIIAFRDDGGHVVTHRIVEVVESDGVVFGFVTKGDSNDSNDSGLVDPERIEGKYLFKMSGFGDVVLLMQKSLSLCLVLFAIVVIGVFWIMSGRNKLSKEERVELEKLRKKDREGKVRTKEKSEEANGGKDEVK